MLGTYKKIAYLLVTLFIMVGLVLASPSKISQVGLTHEGSFTVLTIEGSSTIRVAHESVEAKEGKPFRIVIDCLASRHGLSQNFKIGPQRTRGEHSGLRTLALPFVPIFKPLTAIF